ncbi:hypothetical protein B0H13DRAFT_1594918 [Mycena leptocephala]|nr:hypothetical protein B0H13DRAFT_1594918 [Mycena leptocephala]
MSHPSAGPQNLLHAARPPAHADLSTPPVSEHPSSYPTPSDFTSAHGNLDPSSGRDSPGHLPSYPTLFHGVPAESGTFITAQNVNHIHRRGETGINILHRAVALEALYNSPESFPQPKCHPQTRTMILDDLYSWATAGESASPIFWLYGPAGAGKSAIMQTLCQRLDHSRRLAGSFFFKRGHSTRGSAKTFFITLAYQLALRNTSLTDVISKIVEDDPSVVGLSMNAQLQKLIVEPCQSLRNRPPTILNQPSYSVENCKPHIFLIDGLDEYEGQNIQQELLRLISDAVLHNPRMLRILIASRPEPHIREILERQSTQPLSRNLALKRAFADVEQYLRDEFSRIHYEHRDTMERIPSPWPSREILNILVEKSSGYFIYASTIIKFIDDKDFRPTERLAAVVHWQNLPTDSDRPFEALYQLYTQFISCAPDRSRVIRILTAITHFLHLAMGDIELLLGLNPGDVALSLRRLHSIYDIPSNGHVSVYHASIPDFLGDPTRSDKFCVNTLQRRMELARSVLKALSGTYDVSIDRSSSKYMTRYAAIFSVVAAQ